VRDDADDALERVHVRVARERGDVYRRQRAPVDAAALAVKAEGRQHQRPIARLGRFVHSWPRANAKRGPSAAGRAVAALLLGQQL
jgi:hypothetical protein